MSLNILHLLIVLALAAISNAQSDNCTVYKTQNRTCTGTNCQTSQTDSQSFNICPVMTNSEINTVVSTRANQTTQQLNQIANQTSAALANVQVEYASRIKTSTGFGYIAGGFIGVIFLVPAFFDVFNAFTGKNIAKSKPRRRIKRLKYIPH